MGRGMRRFVSDWYLKKDPYDLALEVFRIKSRHKWSHADMIKLARVRTEDPAISAVLKAVVRGLDDAQEAFKDKPEAQPILEYMACVKVGIIFIHHSHFFFMTFFVGYEHMRGS